MNEHGALGERNHGIDGAAQERRIPVLALRSTRMARSAFLAAALLAAVPGAESLDPAVPAPSATRAAGEGEEVATIVTSRPQRLPRLMTLQTSEVLESYSIGFAGSGNVHHAASKGEWLSGTVYAGLGDVAELGYALEEVTTTSEDPQHLMRGHINLALLREGRWTPGMSVGFGSTFDGKIEDGGSEWNIGRDVYYLGLGKTFTAGEYRISLYPSLQLVTDELKTEGRGKKPSGEVVHANLGATWQRSEGVMFMAEAKYGSALELAALERQEVAHQPMYEGNVGVRFYLRNWLFMDAGIRHQELPDIEERRTSIHANVTGVLPLRAIGRRIAGVAG